MGGGAGGPLWYQVLKKDMFHLSSYNIRAGGGWCPNQEASFCIFWGPQSCGVLAPSAAEVEHLNSQELWADVGHQVRLVLQMRQLSFQDGRGGSLSERGHGQTNFG